MNEDDISPKRGSEQIWTELVNSSKVETNISMLKPKNLKWQTQKNLILSTSKDRLNHLWLI